jgi:anti-sigma B factor antagonist
VPEGALRIETTESDGWVSVAVAGELDLAEAAEAEKAVQDALHRPSRGLVVDLRRVTFLGSTGIRVLLDAQAAALGAGRRFRVVQGDGAARRLIELLGLTERLEVVDAGD